MPKKRQYCRDTLKHPLRDVSENDFLALKPVAMAKS